MISLFTCQTAVQTTLRRPVSRFFGSRRTGPRLIFFPLGKEGGRAPKRRVGCGSPHPERALLGHAERALLRHAKDALRRRPAPLLRGRSPSGALPRHFHELRVARGSSELHWAAYGGAPSVLELAPLRVVVPAGSEPEVAPSARS